MALEKPLNSGIKRVTAPQPMAGFAQRCKLPGVVGAEATYALRALLLAGNPRSRRVRPAGPGRGRGRLCRCRPPPRMLRCRRHEAIDERRAPAARALCPTLPQGRQTGDRAERPDPALPGTTPETRAAPRS